MRRTKYSSRRQSLHQITRVKHVKSANYWQVILVCSISTQQMQHGAVYFDSTLDERSTNPLHSHKSTKSVVLPRIQHANVSLLYQAEGVHLPHRANLLSFEFDSRLRWEARGWQVNGAKSHIFINLAFPHLSFQQPQLPSSKAIVTTKESRVELLLYTFLFLSNQSFLPIA